MPVVGMADASILQACSMGNRFSIVTGGERWKSMLEEFVASQRRFPRGSRQCAPWRRPAPTSRARSEGRDGPAGQGVQLPACARTAPMW